MKPEDTPAWEREIRALEEEVRRAFVARDLDALQGLWTDEYAVNSPLNEVVEKDQVLGLLRDGRIGHSSFDFRIEHFRRHGDVVVVMGQEMVSDSPGGSALERRYTHVWRNEAGAWRAIARHANVINAAG